MNNRKISAHQLVESYGWIISRLSHRMIRNNELAQEAAQEVLYEIIKSLDSFRADAKITTWIYTIAKRTIMRYALSERVYKIREINTHFDLDSIGYDGSEEEKEMWVKEKCDHCLTAFCHCLDNKSRLIFLFREIAGLTYSQISEIMQITVDNVRRILSRSRAKVKNFMNRNCILYNPDGACKCRIRKHILAVDLDDEYKKLAKAAKLVNLFRKFDKELPRKNYWEKLIAEAVTN